MTKRKKNLAKYTTQGFGAKNLEGELRRAEGYLIKEDWREASHILCALSQQYPTDKRVWQYLADASFEIGDMTLYQKACEGLVAVAPHNSDYAYCLASAYLTNLHPLMALQAFRQALVLDPNHEHAPRSRETIERLEPMLQGVLDDMGLTEADGLEIALLHERGQAYLEQGDYAAAREAEEAVVKRHPEFMSAFNNLALISWMQGDDAGAIATTQAVLAREPENIHALANVIHFLVVLGDGEAARSYGDKLKASQANAWDGWTKKIEGLSYLADDAGAVEVFEQAQADDVEISAASALFFHWAAVALARTGDEKRAKAQWQAALDRDPSLSLAQDNLNDIRKPVGQRHGAWPFSWEQWFRPESSKELWQTLRAHLNSGQTGKLRSGMQDFLAHHGDVLAMLPRVAERGGPVGQEFVLNIAEQFKTPDQLAIIKDFALGQNGTDAMRHRAALIAAKAQLIPKDKVTLWLGGEWRDIMLLSYEFHSNPTVKHSKKVNQGLERALNLLREGGKDQAIKAETLLTQAIQAEPESPDLLNNLAIAYLYQNRDPEAYALIREITVRFPDYVMASASQARLYLDDGDIDAAEAILKPFLARDRFHFLEFNAFADAYIELLMAQKKLDGARTWVQLWGQADPDAPRLAYWQQRLGKGKLKPLPGFE